MLKSHASCAREVPPDFHSYLVKIIYKSAAAVDGVSGSDHRFCCRAHRKRHPRRPIVGAGPRPPLRRERGAVPPLVVVALAGQGASVRELQIALRTLQGLDPENDLGRWVI